MLNFKKILAVSCSILFASSMGSAYAQSTLWEVGVSALYLQPSLAGNGLGYSTFSSYAGANNSGVIVSANGANQINNVTPKWGLGFEIEGAFYYRVGSDVNLNWYHLHENTHGNLPAGSLFSGSADGMYAGNLQLATTWDALNVELGKHILLNDRKLLRLHAGVEVARIKNTFINQPKIFETGPPFLTTTDKLSYSGWGPRFGADFGYAVNNGFSLYAKAAGSVLVGTARQTVSGYHDYFSSNYGVVVFGIPNYTASNRNVVVPELEAKLGIAYSYKLAQGNLGVDLGYLWMNYLNAITSYTGVGIVSSSVGIPATSNFNLNGLYLRIIWTG